MRSPITLSIPLIFLLIITLPARSQVDTLQILQMIEECEKYYEEGDMDSSLFIANRILDTSKVKKFQYGIGEGYFWIGKINFRYFSRKNALINLDDALRIFVEIQEKERIADVYNLKGLIYKDEGRFDLAIEYYNEALQIYLDLNLLSKIAQIASNLGVVYRNKGDYLLAIENFYRCLSIYLSNNNEEGVASVSVNVSNIYLDLEEYDLALLNLKEAEKYYVSVKNPRAYSLVLINLGLAYYHKDFLDSAKLCLEKAIQISELINNNYFLANAYFILGDIKVKQHKPEEAYGSFERSLQYYNKNEYKSTLISEIYCSKALLLNDIGFPKKGNELIIEGIRIAKEKEDVFVYLKCLYSAYEFNLSNKNLKAAINYLEKYVNEKKQIGGFSSAFDVSIKNSNLEFIKLKSSLTESSKENDLLIKRNSKLILFQKISFFAIVICLMIIILTFRKLRISIKKNNKLIKEYDIMKRSRPYFQDGILRYRTSS